MAPTTSVSENMGGSSAPVAATTMAAIVAATNSAPEKTAGAAQAPGSTTASSGGSSNSSNGASGSAAATVTAENANPAKVAAAVAKPAAVASAWGVPGQITSAKKSVVVQDPESWPDPATAASEPIASQRNTQAQTQTQQPTQQPQPAPKKQGKKGKDKWVPLETEINYTKPKGALQSAAGPQRQQRQQQQKNQHAQKPQQKQQYHQQNGNANKSAAGAPVARALENGNDADSPKPGAAAKKPLAAGDAQNAPRQQQERSEQQDQQNQGQGETGSRGTNQHGRSQRQGIRGRGRGNSQNAAYGRRGGHRIAGHAPSHYQGKGNVQPGFHTSVSLPQPVAGDEESMKSFVQAQVEYYFSVDNLCKDIFFRTQMDSNGYVPLSLVAGFNRIKTVTTDLDLIREVMDSSEKVELNESGNLVRKHGDWATWLFPTPEFVLKQQQQQQQQQQQSENSLKSE
ncbi:hypothetical protein H4217_005623 [Coemansia sp. RSA 1939]|nr:hypothetical protein H4217_005623 [Coemansia sp. RSA 1939]